VRSFRRPPRRRSANRATAPRYAMFPRKSAGWCTPSMALLRVVRASTKSTMTCRSSWEAATTSRTCGPRRPPRRPVFTRRTRWKTTYTTRFVQAG
jgi:hypothetical protein